MRRSHIPAPLPILPQRIQPKYRTFFCPGSLSRPAMKTSRSITFSRFSTPLPFITFFLFYFLFVRKQFFRRRVRNLLNLKNLLVVFPEKIFPAVPIGGDRRHPLARGSPPPPLELRSNAVLNSSVGYHAGAGDRTMHYLDIGFGSVIECRASISITRQFYILFCCVMLRTCLGGRTYVSL